MRINSKYILYGLAVLILVGVGYYFYKEISNNSAISDVVLENNQNNENLDYTIEVIPVTSDNTIPDLNRDVGFNDSNQKTVGNIKEISELLKKDQTQIALWLDLASLRKSIGDFEGAKLVWEYITKIAPNQAVAYGNLGSLHAYYLHDNEKAEEYFSLAIQKNPNEAFWYSQLFDFYRDVLKNSEKARAIAQEGMEKTGDKAFFEGLISALNTNE